ncbi:MAG: Fic family protein [Pseudomonadales bacterium]
MKLPKDPPSLDSLAKPGDDDTGITRIVSLLSTDLGKDRESEYLHWDKMRFKPLPEGINSHEEWWKLTKFRRWSSYRKLPFKSVDAQNFLYWLPDPLQLLLHQIDQQASGRVETRELVTNEDTRKRYLVSSLIEEAITSSQLEGASTTHKVAKAMLREGRPPRDKSERMIVNNYQAMEFIRNNTGEPLSLALLLELHQIVTEGTLEASDREGRLRTASDFVAVFDVRDNTLLHEPPPASELEGRIATLCEFANTESVGGEFVHPIVRSIILHFMIGYDHPFVDGNGRTARALFYWSMARHGYWMMEYISISTILKAGPSKYARAYLYAEHDEYDVTYFIDFNLKVITRAIKKLQAYLARKASEIAEVETILSSTVLARHLNYRQMALISHALRNPSERYTVESHRKSHRVTYPTARSDLLKLVEHGLLTVSKIGRAYVFRSASDIKKRLELLKAE